MNRLGPSSLVVWILDYKNKIYGDYLEWQREGARELSIVINDDVLES